MMVPKSRAFRFCCVFFRLLLVVVVVWFCCSSSNKNDRGCYGFVLPPTTTMMRSPTTTIIHTSSSTHSLSSSPFSQSGILLSSSSSSSPPETTMKMTMTSRTVKRMTSSSRLYQSSSSSSSDADIDDDDLVSTGNKAKLICTFDDDDFDGSAGDWPYEEKDFLRFDVTDDSKFYDSPKFVTHIDDLAITSLTQYYSSAFEEYYNNNINGKQPLDILDLCSSWISHYPTTTTEKTSFEYGTVVGMGMNEEELKANKQLTSYQIQDLNIQPKLSQFEDNTFDFITCTVSVDYLIFPQIVFQELYRILKPNGSLLISFSNRYFATKAINMWLQADDIGRLTIVGSYFHYSAPWKVIDSYDLKPKLETPTRPKPNELFTNPSLGIAWMNSAASVAKYNAGDPMFMVRGVK